MPATDFADFVPHPRYGRSPIESDEDVPLRLYRDHWRYTSQADRLYPETAIRANVAHQRPSPVPLPAYADLRVDCRTCGRPFLFFAVEQKHWYEELGFPLDARCVDCPECREQNQRTQRLRRRQEDLLSRLDELDDIGWLELAEAYAELIRRGIMKKPDKVRWALNRVDDRELHATEIGRILESVECE